MRNTATIIILFIVLSGCKKKEQPTPSTNQNNTPPPTSTYKKLKTTRSVNSYSTSGVTSISYETINYDQNTGKISSIDCLDSSYNNPTWQVGTYTKVFNYNSSGNLTSIVYQASSATYTIAIVYDSNNKPLYDIMPPDTTTYTYLGSSMRATRKTSSGIQVDYYSDNLDSTVDYNSSNVPVLRNISTYNQTIDLHYAYLNQIYPLSLCSSKYEEVSFLGGGSTPLATYQYTYDSQNYPILKKQVGGGAYSTDEYYSYY